MNKQFLFTSAFLLMFSSPQTLADAQEGVLEGRYIPVKGHSQSREVSRADLGETPKQVGKYKLVLKREGWNELSDEEQERIRKKLVIKGEFTGVMNMANMTVDHTMVNKDKSGTLYTQGDFLIPSQGDAVCSSGVPLAGVEQVNFVAGSGEYQNLISGTIFLAAEVNNCPGTQGFLRNQFSVIKGEGALEFAPAN